MTAAVVNTDAEQVALGSLLQVTGSRVRAVRADVGLRAEHFYLDRHRLIFEAILAVADKTNPDILLVDQELDRRGEKDHRPYLFQLAEMPGAVGNVLHYAQVVTEAADWRGKQLAALMIQEAVKARDRGKLGEAEAILGRDIVHTGTTYNKPALEAVARGLAEMGGAETFRYPFNRLNQFTAGGMRRGEFVLIGGHTGHGKTVFLDQLLDFLHVQKRRTQLYLTEMTIQERVARTMSRNTGIPFERIIQGKMDEAEAGRYEDGIGKALKVGMTDATGWSVEEITAHIRSNRWDVAAVDTVHDIPHRDTEDLQVIARTLATCSRQAECALVGVVHLNRGRIKSIKAPRPGRNDILGSGAFAQTANTVCFVHREENDKGFPTMDGWVYFGKVRNGQLGEVRVTLNPHRFRFQESSYRDDDGDPGPFPPSGTPH